MTPQNEARRAIALTSVYDIGAAALAMFIAIEMRWRVFSDYNFRPFPEEIPYISAMLFAVAATISFICLKIYRQVWRHAGFSDIMRVLQATFLAILIFLPIMFIYNRLDGFPRSSLLLCLPIWIGFLLGGRMLALLRSTRQPGRLFRKQRAGAPNALLVGDEDSLRETLRELALDKRGAPINILGLIDTTGLATGRAIGGITVHGGVGDIGKLLDLFKERYGNYPWVATVGAGRSRKMMRKVLAETSERGSEVMSFGRHDEDGANLSPVQPEDLLGRRERERDMEPISNLVKDRRIFVTGAGGTIGTELCRQCADLKPSHITLYDNSEFNLYQIDLLLRSKFPDVDVETVLGDIRDSGRLTRIMSENNPHIVIHAAALKQVPLMEMNPCEAILTNANGAANAAQAAVTCGAEHFVFISTDKAVDPDNVMGATKRLSEIAIKEIAKDTKLAISMVRFGNVLGSSGSVVPLFEKQIKAGGPVTVTHPDITRYFMTVEEAVYLVLQAAALQKSAGESALYVLDMGRPVRIQSLAENMIRMKGFVPGQDIQIVHSGLRPGDKMHETLTYGHEEILDSGVDGVRIVKTSRPVGQGFQLAFESLVKAASERDPARAVFQLNAMISNFAQLAEQGDGARSA